MAVTISDIRAFDRTFADPVRYPDELIQTYINDCAVWLDLPRFRTSRDVAHRYWVCHQLTAQADGAAGKSGAVTEQGVGDVKVAYANSNALFEAPDYSLTTYGTNLLRLIRRYVSLGKAVP